jgi:uncharacterized protein YecT (DUF1311 family)
MKYLQALLILVFSVQFSLGQTQSEMNDEAEAEYTKSHAAMNKVYQQILQDYQDDVAFITKLKASQNLWLKFRDAESDMKFSAEDAYEYYGSVYPMCRYYYLADLTDQRTKKLREWLVSPISEEACPGSVKFRD